MGKKLTDILKRPKMKNKQKIRDAIKSKTECLKQTQNTESKNRHIYKNNLINSSE